MATSGNRPDVEVLADVEELAAIGVGYERLISMVQERHHDRARAIYRRTHGYQEDDPVSDEQVPMPRGASSRTIDRYLKAMRERWAKEEVELRPKRREELRAKLQATFLKAYGEGGPSMGAAVRCLAIQAKIDGLEAPQEINLNTQVIDIKSMTPDQRVARIRELYALRQKATQEGKVIDILPAAESKKLPAKKLPAKKTPAKKAKTKKRLKRPRKTSE